MKNKTEKSENRRALPKFFLILLAFGLVGGVIGAFVAIAANTGMGAQAAVWMDGALEAAAPWGIPVTTAVTMGTSLLLYRTAKRRYDSWDGENEDAADQLEVKLSWVLLLSGIQMIFSLFFFSVSTHYQFSGMDVLPAVGVFFLSCGLAIFAQQKAVDLTKRMNPEKRGSVYDLKFQKKWVDSCDEAERRQIGQASYKAFRAAGNACLILWVALVVADMEFDVGVLPVFVVMLLWGVLQVTYTLECIRLGKRGTAVQ